MYLAAANCYFNLSRLSNCKSTDDAYEYDILLIPLDRVNLKFVSEIYTTKENANTELAPNLYVTNSSTFYCSFDFIIVRLL